MTLYCICWSNKASNNLYNALQLARDFRAYPDSYYLTTSCWRPLFSVPHSHHTWPQVLPDRSRTQLAMHIITRPAFRALRNSGGDGSLIRTPRSPAIVYPPWRRPPSWGVWVYQGNAKHKSPKSRAPCRSKPCTRCTGTNRPTCLSNHMIWPWSRTIDPRQFLYGLHGGRWSTGCAKKLLATFYHQL
jgi:hypothetical protein